VVSADVYRPAAIKQLETLAAEVGVDFFASDIAQKPVAIVLAAIEHAKIQFSDVLIVDTAGRLAIDQDMMAEIAELHRVTQPAETLFVVDAMSGQDAATTAKAFGEALPLTGVILTKVDADTRGGAALSVRAITGKPIKFLGVGERTAALDPFHPDRLASRILGMGDVLSLIEEAEQKVDKEKAAKLARKVKEQVVAIGELSQFAADLELRCRRAYLGAGIWGGRSVRIGGGGHRDGLIHRQIGEVGCPFQGDRIDFLREGQARAAVGKSDRQAFPTQAPFAAMAVARHEHATAEVLARQVEERLDRLQDRRLVFRQRLAAREPPRRCFLGRP
jgi:hypothetical protein